MKKIKIDLDILLPDTVDEQDACIQRIVRDLSHRKGIETVHLVPPGRYFKTRLCFHYYPQLISVETVQRLAEQAGARITRRFHHMIFEVEGIRHQRQTKLVEAILKDEKGVLSVAVAATGIIVVEYDAKIISQDAIEGMLKKQGLKIISKGQHHRPGNVKRFEGENSIANQEESRGHFDKKGNDHNHKNGLAHNHKDGNGDKHRHGGIFGKNTELIFSILCGAFLGLGFATTKFDLPETVSLVLYGIAYFFGGYYTAKEAVETITRGGFEIDFLMLVAAVGAAILGNWAEGALLLFLFSLGHALEDYAMEKARKSIAALTELAPKTALLKKDGQTTEVNIDSLEKGDVIIVRPNTKISADGIVVAGSSSVNQAPITGESIPVEKEAADEKAANTNSPDQLDAKHRVFAGTINGNEVLEIKVTREASDSTLSRLVKLVNEAQTQKSPTQQFTDKFERYFVPAVLILVGLLCFGFLVIDESFSDSFYRAMSVLVAASPCALAISTPSAVLSGVARAARAGVLVKGGKPLEDLGTLTALAFDKTGTLTEGKPKLTKIVPLGDTNENDLLKKVVAVESLSDHPIAKAIVRDGKEKLKGEDIKAAHDLEAVLGKGIKAKLEKDEIFAGNLALFESLDEVKPGDNLKKQVQDLEKAGNTTMVIRQNKNYIGIIAVMDTPREEAKETLIKLKDAGIKKMIMLTGDNQEVANAIAKETGLTEAWGGLLPEQKVEAIEKLAQQENKVAMVGDGVNDAPAMAKSTVGIAMGAAGSDVALETADIALMGDKLSLLPFSIGLSRKAKGIIKQNLVISLGVVAVLIPLTIAGIASIGPAVIAHEGSTLVVVFNALRLLAYKKAN